MQISQLIRDRRETYDDRINAGFYAFGGFYYGYRLEQFLSILERSGSSMGKSPELTHQWLGFEPG